MEEPTRICRLCGEEKPLSEFRIRTDSGKRRNECRQCKINYLKKYRSIPKNKNRIAQLNKNPRDEPMGDAALFSDESFRDFAVITNLGKFDNRGVAIDFGIAMDPGVTRYASLAIDLCIARN